MTDDYTKKFKLISERERFLANKLALSLIRPKPLGVWDLLLPVIFILNYIKLKQSREIFIQNQLFTKKMALEAVLDMKKKDASKEAVRAQIQSKTKELVSSVPDGIYSEDIRRQQLKEIDLLIDHYLKLMNAPGVEYNALVTHAYQTAAKYTFFLKQLKSAENDVMAAARRTLGSKTDMVTAEKIESLTDRLRAAEVNNIFSSDFQPPDAE